MLKTYRTFFAVDVKKKMLTYEFFSIRVFFMEKQMRFLKEKLGTWKKVATFLDISERYCLIIVKTGKAGRHLERIIKQKVELYQ